MPSLLLSVSPSKTSLQIVSVQGGGLLLLFLNQTYLFGDTSLLPFFSHFRTSIFKKGEEFSEKGFMRIWAKRIWGVSPPIVGNMRKLAFYVWQKIWICCFKTSQNLQILPVTNIKAVLADFCKCHKCNRLKWFANYKCTRGHEANQLFKVNRFFFVQEETNVQFVRQVTLRRGNDTISNSDCHL